MVTMLISTAFVVFIIKLKASVDAAAYILPPQDKPAIYACLEGCYVKELNSVLPYNYTCSPQNGTQCTQYNCGPDGYTSVYTCSPIAVSDDCTIVDGDLYKPYPDCCHTASCPAFPATAPKPSPSVPKCPTSSRLCKKPPKIPECPSYPPPKDSPDVQDAAIQRPPICNPPVTPKKPKLPKCPTYPPPRYSPDVEEASIQRPPIRCYYDDPPVFLDPVKPDEA